jgi:hypothetical protein
MSERGEAKDASTSGAKPRPEGRVRERGWRPTYNWFVQLASPWRTHRRARPRAIARGRCSGASRNEGSGEAAA